MTIDGSFLTLSALAHKRGMVAYYTKEDITEYIGKNTVVPFLFDAARAKCKLALENPGSPTVGIC